MGGTALPPTRSSDQFFNLQIDLIIILGYWLGGGVGGAAPPPTRSSDQFFNLHIDLIIILGYWLG